MLFKTNTNTIKMHSLRNRHAHKCIVVIFIHDYDYFDNVIDYNYFGNVIDCSIKITWPFWPLWFSSSMITRMLLTITQEYFIYVE